MNLFLTVSMVAFLNTRRLSLSLAALIFSKI